VAAALAAAALAIPAGCNGSEEPQPQPERSAPAPAEPLVRVVRPERRTIRHQIRQPGFNIEPFQETLLYAKITGYVARWNVDIGDRVRKGDVLAELDVPEMVVDVRQKEAALRRADAQVRQANAALLTAQAQAERARSQAGRLARIGKRGSLDRESVDEARLGYQAAKANLEKARADKAAAEAEVEVARAHRDYAQVMLRYATIRAPFDGVVTQKNANTGDFVQPAGAGTRGRPLFVVDQDDPVRVFVNVPGADAAWIKDGDPVTLRLQGAGGELFRGKVTRNARALDPRTRTLRTEIDLPNPHRQLRPGMYVQATITVRHPNAWTLPADAIVTQGDQTFCYRLENGRAVRTPLQVGPRGGGRVEVLKIQARAASADEEARWEKVRGSEEVITGDLAALSDGQRVRRARDMK
jgi:multidrug efflux pump subunit AcrA (membrane-fusion protein)